MAHTRQNIFQVMARTRQRNSGLTSWNHLTVGDNTFSGGELGSVRWWHHIKGFEWMNNSRWRTYWQLFFVCLVFFNSDSNSFYFVALNVMLLETQDHNKWTVISRVYVFSSSDRRPLGRKLVPVFGTFVTGPHRKKKSLKLFPFHLLSENELCFILKNHRILWVPSI